MTTKKVLTEKDREAVYNNSCLARSLDGVSDVRSAIEYTEEAVLKSPEVQAWKRDSERYKWLKEQFRIMSLDMEGNHKWVLQRPLQSRGPTMDAVCDDAMEQQA